MASIGETLKRYRSKKKLSFVKLERLTKIKKNFLQAIETEDWVKLPEFPIVAGFVRSFASSVGANQDHMVALLRRDYPPKKLALTPKPDIPNKTFLWNPRMTSIAFAVLAIVGIITYLFIQYINFTKNPLLIVEYPLDGETVNSSTLVVKGTVDPDAGVFVNNQPAFVSSEGQFDTEINITETTEEIEIKAISRTGKESVIKRKIKVEFEN